MVTPDLGNGKSKPPGARANRAPRLVEALDSGIRAPSLRPRALFLLVDGPGGAEAGHGHEHVLETFGQLGIEVQPALHQGFRRHLLDVRHHLLLQLFHHRRLHRRDIRKSEELAGLQRRAVYLDIDLHVLTPL